jgi:dinuclear metal center YbgI/SA1388 family protein
MTTLHELMAHLEAFAPPSLQESYDNAGLIVGDPNTEVKGVIIALDCTEEVVEEAMATGCNVIVAHHPIVFSGMKRFNGKTYVERTVMKAIKHDIAIYAMHTNLDNVRHGVNRKIAERLGLMNLRVLAPKRGLLRKLVVFVPLAETEAVRSALFAAGAGSIGNYDECSFGLAGTGSFRGREGAQPTVGQVGEHRRESEERIEVIFEAWKESAVLAGLRKSMTYEEIAYDIYSLENTHQGIGAGMVGELENPVSEQEFLLHVKKSMQAGVVRHTRLIGKKVKKVAICGGSGSFLLKDAKKAGADVFVTADFKYHEFFDAEGTLVIADIGHFESEQFTGELIHSLILEKFTTFAVRLTGVNTNPLQYL